MYTYINKQGLAITLENYEIEFLVTLKSSHSVVVDHKNKIIKCI